ncbi:unnamed protein product [Adineta steineri]|uniref:Uncharacterized protein n=1 Tax=Adineta steineri TaxID=433720 RepID=A0A819A8U9_9BILA|nr:unnamed protein product [Adineta steineri]
MKPSIVSTNELPTSREQQIRISPKIKFSAWHTFKHHIPRFILTILIDIVFPLVIYFGLQKLTKPVYALLLAGTPPLLMVIGKALISRTFDALGFLIFIGFIISGVVAIITRNSIILLLEKSLVTGILSLIFGITLIPFHCCSSRFKLRPLAYYFYQDLVPTNRAQVGLLESAFNEEHDQANDQYAQLKEEITVPKLSDKEEVAKVYEWIYKHCPSFRFACYTITSIWSIGLLLEFIARLTLILMHLPINKIVIYAHVILSSITILCIISSIICIIIERKYTLLSIERWNEQSQQPRKDFSNRRASLVIIECNSNSVSNVNI